jgi:hypothetical protein
MAHIFEEYVHSGNLFLIQDHRQRQQILSVNNELKAPETPMGHGDAFFSIAMALQAAYETGIFRMQTIGSMQEFANELEPPVGKPKDSQKSLLDFPKNEYNNNSNSSSESGAPNPLCTEDVCNPAFWIPKRKLCLHCNYRGQL